MEMKCPSCKSVDVMSRVLAHGYAYVDMQTGDLVDNPDDCDYNQEDLYEFYCNGCDFEWIGDVPKGVFAMWRKKREENWREIEEGRKEIVIRLK